MYNEKIINKKKYIFINLDKNIKVIVIMRMK